MMCFRLNFPAHVIQNVLNHFATLQNRQIKTMVCNDGTQRLIEFFLCRFGCTSHIDGLFPHGKQCFCPMLKHEIVAKKFLELLLYAFAYPTFTRPAFSIGICRMTLMMDVDVHMNIITYFIYFALYPNSFAKGRSFDTIRTVSLTPTQVRHIAKLARLQISDSEVEKYAKELSAILEYVEKLKEVKTDGVEPTAQVTGQSNVLRGDVIEDRGITTDALLDTSPLPIVEQQIETPSAHG